MIGTDHEVEKFAMSISIENSVAFSKNEKGIKSMIVKENKARASFSQRIREKKDTKGGYYNEG